MASMLRMVLQVVMGAVALAAWATVAVGTLCVLEGSATPTAPASLAVWLGLAVLSTGLVVRMRRGGGAAAPGVALDAAALPTS